MNSQEKQKKVYTGGDISRMYVYIDNNIIKERVLAGLWDSRDP